MAAVTITPRERMAVCRALRVDFISTPASSVSSVRGSPGFTRFQRHFDCHSMILELFPALVKVSQVRRRLSGAGRHEVAVAAHIVALRAEPDLVVVLDAIDLGPDHLLDALIAARHHPGPRQGVI